MKAVLVAFGTRGDVQPLALLACTIAQQVELYSETVFVTHREHSDWLQKVFESEAPVIRSSDNSSSISKSYTHATVNGNEHRNEHSSGCGGASRVRSILIDTPTFPQEKNENEHAEHTASASVIQLTACLQAVRGAGVMICTLFSLEAVVVAHELGIPVVLTHPYLIPSGGMPHGFKAWLRRARPALYRALQQSACTTVAVGATNDSSRDSGVFTADSYVVIDNQAHQIHTEKHTSAADVVVPAHHPAQQKITWSDVEHWMWPLLTPHWESIREEVGFVPGHTKFLGMLQRGETPSPVLYGFSELLVDRSPFWSPSVQLCGAILPPKSPEISNTTTSSQTHELEKWLSKSDTKPVYITLGSAASVCSAGGTHNIRMIMKALVAGVVHAGHRCIVHDTPESGGTDAVHWLMSDTFCSNFSPSSTYTKTHTNTCADMNTESNTCYTNFSPENTYTKTYNNSVHTKTHNNSVHTNSEIKMNKFADSCFIVHGDVPHAWLLSKCLMVVHHGGSGTVAAGCAAGIPQVMCPLMFDQFFWADRISYLGYGTTLETSLWKTNTQIHNTSHAYDNTTPSLVMIKAVSKAVCTAAQPGFRFRVACFGVKFRQEGASGLVNTACAIQKYLLACTQRRDCDTTPTVKPEKLFNTSVDSIHTEDMCVCSDIDNIHVHTKTNSIIEEKEHGKSNPQSSQKDAPKGSHDGPNGSETDVAHLSHMHMCDGLSVVYTSGTESEVAHIHREVFMDNIYAQGGVKMPAAGDGIIIDCGAHIGLFFICAAIHMEENGDSENGTPIPSGTILAFEPNPEIYAALKQNVVNHGGGAVHTYNIALGSTNADAGELWCCSSSPACSTLSHHVSSRREAVDATLNPFLLPVQWSPVKCVVRTLSSVLQDIGGNAVAGSISLLKVDVEGHELEVLAGVSDKDWERTRQVVLEVHSERRNPETGLENTGRVGENTETVVENPKMVVENTTRVLENTGTTAENIERVGENDETVVEKITNMLLRKGFSVVTSSPSEEHENVMVYATKNK